MSFCIRIREISLSLSRNSVLRTVAATDKPGSELTVSLTTFQVFGTPPHFSGKISQGCRRYYTRIVEIDDRNSRIDLHTRGFGY